MASVEKSRRFLRATGQRALPTDKGSSTQRVAVVQRLDATARSFHAFWVIAAGEVYFSELYSRCRRAGKPWYAVQSTAIRFRTLSQREDGREQRVPAAALDGSLRAVRGAYMKIGRPGDRNVYTAVILVRWRFIYPLFASKLGGHLTDHPWAATPTCGTGSLVDGLVP